MAIVKRYTHANRSPFAADHAAQRRADFPTPVVISDVMDLTRNPQNGQHYDSKSQYEKAVREAGCHIVGNDTSYDNPRKPSWKPKKGEIAQSIKDAYDQTVGT